jgi:hypothetical protein
MRLLVFVLLALRSAVALDTIVSAISTVTKEAAPTIEVASIIQAPGFNPTIGELQSIQAIIVIDGELTWKANPSIKQYGIRCVVTIFGSDHVFLSQGITPLTNLGQERKPVFFNFPVSDVGKFITSGKVDVPYKFVVKPSEPLVGAQKFTTHLQLVYSYSNRR